MLNPAAKIGEGQGTVRVLVVDPRPQRRSVLKGSLRSLDLVQAVLERSSPQDLQQILTESPVDLVMLDQDLDGEDPLAIVQTLRKQPGADQLRFVLVCLATDTEARAKAKAAGLQGILTMPFDLHSLERTIRDALGLGPGSGPAPHPLGLSGGAAPGPEAQSARERAVSPEILARLRRVQLFQGFRDPELIRLLKICQIRNFIANQYVFREGEPGASLYVLVAGQVDIRQTRDNAEKVLVTMKPGDCFGEMAILDSGPRSADAFAVTPCMVIEVKAETVNRDDDPIALKLVRQIAILLVQKLRRASK